MAVLKTVPISNRDFPFSTSMPLAAIAEAIKYLFRTSQVKLVLDQTGCSNFFSSVVIP